MVMEDEQEAGHSFDATHLSLMARYPKYQEVVSRGEDEDRWVGDYLVAADQISREWTWFTGWPIPLKDLHMEISMVSIEKTAGLLECTLREQGDVATARWQSAGSLRTDQSGVPDGDKNEENREAWKSLVGIKILQIIIPGAGGMEQMSVDEIMTSGFPDQIHMLKDNARFKLFRSHWSEGLTRQILETKHCYITSMQNAAHHEQWGRSSDSQRSVKKLNAIKDFLVSMPTRIAEMERRKITRTITSQHALPEDAP